uniref:Metal ion transporter family n=1 Tax=Micromonas pusilla TaxID=38833 RepID=A0A6U0RNZ9_MICPS|mmetsp:Transcript_976/g.3958  ORF Transcript_976/g.3958 Transcript_976/m.3958 type:complete len:543 (+) Transcript_976:109-1737(+)
MMSMSSMSIDSEDNGEFDAIATGERSDGGQLGASGKEQKEKSAPDVRVEGMDDDDSFSLRKFAAFVGPGFLVCIAYVDPGNFESNLQAGCQFGYSLLWVLLWATLMGLYIQALSVRLGLATGWHLARVMRDEYPTPARYSLWIVTELAIIASDVPEVIGTALALKLIFGLPTVWGVLVTSASTLLFLALQQFGVRKLEAFMGSLVGVMSVCFVAQMGMLEGGDGGEVIKGIVVPIFQNGKALFIGISLLGAVVMPHNLFLHSALVLSRSFELGERAVRRALKYNVAESALALAVTLVINFAVTIVAAQSIRDADFDDPTGEKRRGIIDRPLQNAPDMLKDVLGKSAKGLFAAALLASGQSSTITGTYAGQFVMEGFLEIKINPVLRAFLTRTCAILPSLLVTIIAGDEYAEFLIVISSVFLSFQLPFALIPLVKFCGSEKIVGAMAIDPRALQRTWVIVSTIVFANIVLLCVWVHESGAVNGSPGGVFLGLFVALFMILYCASLSALALRPVTQNLTMQVRDRLESKDFDRQDTSAEGEEYI